MFQCPKCGMTSHHPTDAAEGYCGHCHDYTGVAPAMETRLAIVVIYKDPSDYPGKFVARRQWATGAVVTAEAEPIAVTDNLSGVRATIPPGMVRLNRMPEDDPTIVETWI